MERFDEDLEKLMLKLTEGEHDNVIADLERVRDKLMDLREKNLVKINHSVLELVCAKYLVKAGYCVEVEYQLNNLLTCDLYAVKGEGKIVLEIETGFTPPEHALDPYSYNKARTASKIARYSSFADKFILGTVPTNILPIPAVFLKPPKYRRMSEVGAVKSLCDAYYKNPPITHEEIKNSRLHAIYVIDVDRGIVREIDPEIYLETTSKAPLMET